MIYVVHSTYEWEFSTRVWKESEWKRVRVIGAGSSGEVWLEEGGEGKLRAVKELRRSTLETSFTQELLTLVKLKDHRDLFLNLIGWYENANHIFLAMEYIEYGSLGVYTKDSQKVKEIEAKEITRQILEGLDVLHQKKICHRDVKPENILIVSIYPIWVKIADFGISKRTKHTPLQTSCGTVGYLAPELQGVYPPRTRGVHTHALNLWSLGCLVHKILTSHKPFFDIGGGETLDSAVVKFPEQPIINMPSLVDYCGGKIQLPIEALKKSHVSEKGIAFIKSLLIAKPEDRPTAAYALRHPWLVGYKTHWFENLKNEFLDIGARLHVDLDSESSESLLVRKVGKVDVMQFLPAVPVKRYRLLLLQAVEKGYNSAISMLLRSPGCESVDGITRGKLFQLATEAGRFDTVKILMHNKVDIGACIGDETVLQWAFKQRHLDTIIVLLENKCEGGQKILQAASKDGYTDLVRLLLNSNVDVNAAAADDGGRTALQAAARGGHIEIVKILLEHGADVNAAAAEDNGRTALQAAVEGRYSDIVRLLLENKANVNTAGGVYGGRAALKAVERVEIPTSDITRVLKRRDSEGHGIETVQP